MATTKIISTLILIHAAFGGIALLSGSIAILTKKGSSIHKKSGKVFHYSMLISALIALIVSMLPSNFSPFLFVVGVFTIYLILTGYAALSFKRISSQADIKWSKITSYTMFVVGLIMIIVGALNINHNNGMYIVMLIFGCIGTLNAFQDLRAYRNLKQLKRKWLQIHIGKMTGGYIAAVTAFIVVNQWIPGIFGWLAPTILGTFYIFYWTKKVGPKKKVTLQS